jgi:hypothetical protein
VCRMLGGKLKNGRDALGKFAQPQGGRIAGSYRGRENRSPRPSIRVYARFLILYQVTPVAYGSLFRLATTTSRSSESCEFVYLPVG